MEEQLSSRNKKGSSESALVDTLAPPPAPLSDGEKSQYEALITDLYHQLDDKVGLTWTWAWNWNWAWIWALDWALTRAWRTLK